jgi:hypothetical protein
MVMSDADSGTETETILSVKPGSSRSSTIAAFYRAVDEFYSNRSAVDVQIESDTSDEDSDVRTDERLGSSPDDGEADSVPGGRTPDQGDSSPPTELGGTPSDDGATGDPDNASEPPSGTDVESTSIERAESESEPSEGERRTSPFYFAPLFHSRGDRID